MKKLVYYMPLIFVLAISILFFSGNMNSYFQNDKTENLKEQKKLETGQREENTDTETENEDISRLTIVFVVVSIITIILRVSHRRKLKEDYQYSLRVDERK